MSHCLSGVCLGLNVSMSQMSQCLRALPPLCLTASPSQCLRCLSVSGPCPPLSHSLPVTMSQCLYVSGGSAWASMAMSQCLRGVCLGQHGASQRLNASVVSAGSAWASTERLNVSVVSAGSAWASTERLNVSMSQLSRRGLPGPARRSQCLNVSVVSGGVCLGQHGAFQCLNVSIVSAGSAWASSALSMSQCLSCLGGGLSVSGRSAWGGPGPAQPRLNVSVPQGGLPGGDQDQRSRVSMSQVSPCLWESLASEPAASVGEHPERRRASRASASIKVGFGLGCEKATQKKARPALPKPGTTPQPAKLPLEHTARAGRMQGSLVGLRVLRVRARGFGT